MASRALKYIGLITYLLIHSDILSGQAISNGVLGKTIESSTRDPLTFVIVNLRQLPDSSLITSISTDENGLFGFSDIVPGLYFIETMLLGFQTKNSDPFEIQHEDHIDLGEVSMVVDDIILDQIEITAINPVMINAIDRKIYYPEHDIQGQSGSATDILQNIPSITVGPEGEVLMRGSGNIQYLLNGKKSALLNANIEEFLAQIPAHTIERIEIITNPSAKYKPDGVAGLINIVTKKNILPGFNGNILANASTQGRYNGNISLNYNPGKFNISGLYGYWQNYNPRTYSDQRIVRDSFSEDETYFDLRNESIHEPRSHTATLALDYQPNEKNSISLSGSYWDMKADRNGESVTVESNSMGIINDYTTTRSEDDDESELELGMIGEHTFEKEDHSISFEATYSDFDEVEDSYFKDIYEVPAYPPFEGHNLVHIIGQITTFSVDYSNPFSETLVFETGVEGEYSSGDLDYYTEYFDSDDNTWITDIAKTNRYLYTQDINAAYATLSKNINALGILAGLRAEQTYIKSNLVNYDSIIPNDYFNLFPTLHLSYELSESEEMGLSYSRRVNRPDPDELNPFPEYENIRDIEAGNPHLKPEQVHSIELGYHLQKDHFAFLPTIYYRQTYDGFAEETRYINDSTLLTTQVNLAREQSGGLEFIFTWTPDNKLNFNFNTNLFYNTIDASNLGYEDDKDIVSANMKLGAFYNIFPSTKIQLNASYRSEMLTAQGRSLPVAFLNAGIKQDLFKKKASVTLTISDIFNSMRWRYIIDTPLLYQEVERKRKSQVVYLGFSYRFGVSSKKNGEELIFDDRM